MTQRENLHNYTGATPEYHGKPNQSKDLLATNPWLADECKRLSCLLW